jgi:16S rRNA processing protein RimM
MEPTAASRSSIEPTRSAGARVPIGRIVGAHGLRGTLRVRYFADAAENLLDLKRVALGRSEDDPEARPFDVRAAAPGRPGELRLDLAGLRTRDEGLEHKGLFVMAAPGELRALGPGEYYGYQLLGCRVEGEDGRAVGTLREIWETGGCDLLVVLDAGGGQHLLPAALLRRFDLEARRLVVEILPGLLPAE